jgi:Tfp pilus assembly protein PilN
MRPVNLMPPDERRDKIVGRTGPMAYLLVGALALALAAVTLLVLTNNQVSDKKAQVAELQGQEAAARQQADQLSPFASFKSLEQQRTDTIRSLADSRFDWERVMNELGRIIPSDVWLTEMSGAVAGGQSGSDTSSTADTSSIAGPSLTLSGCAAGQEAVAGFLSALRDIDGVTRVGLTSSERPTGGAAASSSDSASSSGGASSDCRTRDFITKFEIVAAFDEVPAPAIAGAAPATPSATPPAPGAPATTPPASGSESTTPPPAAAESTPASNAGS